MSATTVHPSFTDNELSALQRLPSSRQLSIKKSPKNDCLSEQIEPEEFANEDFSAFGRVIFPLNTSAKI